MTPEEFRYLKAAVEALGNPETSQMAQHKILRTMSQVSRRAADEIELKFIDRVDADLARNYQDLQNQKLVDILKQ